LHFQNKNKDDNKKRMSQSHSILTSHKKNKDNNKRKESVNLTQS